jgi:phosphatidylserine/phosphatidylglycerophosphate/cardiolipin synthase-like enzyme
MQVLGKGPIRETAGLHFVSRLPISLGDHKKHCSLRDSNYQQQKRRAYRQTAPPNVRILHNVPTRSEPSSGS